MTAPLPPEQLAEAIKRRLWMASPTLKRRATAAEVHDIAVGLADLFAEQAADVDRLQHRVSKLETAFVLAGRSRTRNREARLTAEAEVDRLRAQAAAVEAVRAQVMDTRQFIVEGPLIGRLKVDQLLRAALASGDECRCAPCPGRGNDGHGMEHCAECCWGSGVEADPCCPVHGDETQFLPSGEQVQP